jgi:hypothetical protein
LRDQLGKREQIFVRAGSGGGGEEIVRVAREDELVAGMAVVKIDNAIQPWGQWGCGAHSF